MSYRLALVEYLNTFPFSEGIRLNGLEEKIEMHRVTPSMCAQLFEERKVDISLCPIGALGDMPDYKICGKYCIGADGQVGTVVLLSQVPIDQIKRVRFDDHSRTSNLLLQILARHYWNKEWSYYFDSDDTLPETCLMIGDKVFRHKSEYVYAYDLAEAWKSLTDLPMVFALWIARPDIPQEIIDEIDHAFEIGMESVRNNTAELKEWERDYLLNSISYPLDDAKMEALKMFETLLPVG